MRSTHHVVLQNQDGFVWRPAPRWWNHIFAVTVFGVAIASFVGVAQLPTTKTHQGRVVSSDPVLEHLSVDVVDSLPTPVRHPRRVNAARPYRSPSQAHPNSSTGIFDRTSASTEVQQPTPWVVRIH